MSAHSDHQDPAHRETSAESPRDDGGQQGSVERPTGPGSWRRDASGRWTAQGAPEDPAADSVEEADEAVPLEGELEATTDPTYAPPPSRSARP